MRPPHIGLLLVAVLLSACSGSAEVASQDAPRVVQPGAPGEPSSELGPDAQVEIEVPSHTDADVAFMQGMIHHHAQALEMASLVPNRTARSDLPLFAERLAISQEDEIAQMQRWLADRGEDVPEVGEDHDHDAMPGGLMPGMLTSDELAELAYASGAAFDRLFLEAMRRHHLGALEMVDDLFTRDGAGEEPEIFTLANHIVSDQQIELQRIDALLAEVS